MKKLTQIALFIIIMSAVFMTLGSLMFNYFRGSVSDNDSELVFVVEEGNSYLSLASKLSEENLIKSETFFKFYIKLMTPKPLEACTYYLNETMGVEGIIETFEEGCNTNPDAITITFKEGLPMWNVALEIEKNTNNTKTDVYTVLTDKEYIDSLITKYWFLTDEIKSTDIYYPLEGYLFPNTYEFMDKDVTVKSIFETMLNQTSKILENYRATIAESKYSFHEILTLASIVENEAGTSNDRAGVAGVFLNRLNGGWSLGSDVTTYYAEKLNMYERDLYLSEINEANSYNTRSITMAGILPVGPVCNPGVDSISAALSPSSHEYYFFVADINGETHLTKTNGEHSNKVAELKASGLWFNY